MKRIWTAAGLVVGLLVVAGVYISVRMLGSRQPQTLTYSVVIKGSTMTPATLTAHQGDTIRLSLVTDRNEEIHLHGFDYKFEMKAGVAQSRTFAADRTGNFEIEIEDSSTHLGELDITP
ncbi:MAG: hypothetical protein ACYDAY_08565 [Candidatus Dormibacteria bacterium]